MSSSSTSSSSSASSASSKRPIDPITRTALRYTISAKEYNLLHQYLISRTPPPIQKRTPKPKRFERIVESTDLAEYHVAAIRVALRVFGAVYTGLKGWEVVSERLFSKTKDIKTKAKPNAIRHPNLRIALSFSTILLFHRLLHRFFLRLRASLLEQSAAQFRTRNPRISRLLTSAYTPAVAASLAGFLLGISPADALRVTIAIYVFTRSLEFGYNALADSGYIWSKHGRPWWFGSWMIMPVAGGQLLHAFIFDRECFPESYGRFILKRSPEYIQLRPTDYPVGKPWPGVFDIVDALTEISRLRWLPFVSPILFPATKETLPRSISIISPVTGSAHPSITKTSCALLHPHDPSCARTYVIYFLRAFPQLTKFFALVYGAFALLSYRAIIKAPMPALNRLAARILKMSLFLTGAIGTSWGSICLFANYLPGHILPTQRWILGGFLGGLWAFVARQHERSNFMYSGRLSIDSFWKVGVKRGWWRGVRNGDVLLFVASLALLNVVYEARPGAVQGAVLRKGMGVLRGDGWVDRAAALTGDGEDEKDSEKME